VTHLKIAVLKNPDDAEMGIDLGIALFMAGEYEAARKQLEQTPRSALGEKTARLYAGRAQAALGLYDQAAETFAAVIKDDPDRVEGYFYLGEVEGKRDRFAAAHFNLGEYYLKSDDPQNARFHFNKALEYEKDPAQMDIIRQRLKEMDSRPRFFGFGDKAPGPKDQNGKK
jgi:tetratricopeptide (TPR) repeat protein